MGIQSTDTPGDISDPWYTGNFDHTSIDCAKLDFILEYTLTAMIGIMSYWFNHESTMTREDLHKLIRTLSQEGILNQLRPPNSVTSPKT